MFMLFPVLLAFGASFQKLCQLEISSPAFLQAVSRLPPQESLMSNLNRLIRTCSGLEGLASMADFGTGNKNRSILSADLNLNNNLYHLR